MAVFPQYYGIDIGILLGVQTGNSQQCKIKHEIDVKYKYRKRNGISEWIIEYDWIMKVDWKRLYRTDWLIRY